MEQRQSAPALVHGPVMEAEDDSIFNEIMQLLSDSEEQNKRIDRDIQELKESAQTRALATARLRATLKRLRERVDTLNADLVEAGEAVDEFVASYTAVNDRMSTFLWAYYREGAVQVAAYLLLV